MATITFAFASSAGACAASGARQAFSSTPSRPAPPSARPRALRAFVTDLNGRWSREGRRTCCIDASSSQFDDLDVSLVEGDPYEETETEEEARTRNWKERGWAPWEELRTPEAQFAIDSLADGEDPIISWEDFQKLNRKQYAEKMEKELEEKARKEEEERSKSAKFEGSLWEKPLVFTLTPPRDWPPPGWKVDAKELAYIRQSHTIRSRKVTPQELDESNLQPDGQRYDVPRWQMFSKQYDEWVAANKDSLEKEALEVDGEYYPGRRRTGQEYKEGMYELPFIYPRQQYIGVVSAVSLYEGAFVYFGGVHDGWVPIMDNDWYEIRKKIKVGMRVHVEVMAKRDPYRFRFPIEMRFVDPNIDHLIFRRFKHPPIFGRKEDINLDEVAVSVYAYTPVRWVQWDRRSWCKRVDYLFVPNNLMLGSFGQRESGRPYYPKLRPEIQLGEEETETTVHPYVKMLWMVHEAEQMVLEDEEGVDYGEWDEWATEEEEDPTGEWANEPGILPEIDGLEVPTVVLHVDEKYLNLEEARAEREVFMKMSSEAKAKGEEFEQPEGRFERRVKELNDTHQQRWTEEKEALVRDRTCRLELGLPVEEPGRYADKSFWGKNPYDPREPQWRHDYWGDPAKLKEELRKDKVPRARSEEAAGVDDELEGLGGDVTMIRVGVEAEKERGEFIHDDADTRIIFGESDDRGAVNGTAAKSVTNVRQVIDFEEGDWSFLDDSEVENPEGYKGAGDEPTNDV